MDSFKKAIEQAKARLEGTQNPVMYRLSDRIKSHRAELFKELYSYYELSYKKNAWSDYKRWLGKNRFKHSPVKVAEFRKSKEFRKPIDISSFCSYWFGFLKTEDLYYLISIARDKHNRGENFNKWLFWSIKPNSVV